MAVLPFSAPAILQGPSPAQRLQSRHATRITHYAELRDFYQGKHFTNSRRGHSNIVANYARAIVDKGVAFLFARGIVLQGGAQPRSDDRIAEALANITHDAALGPTLLQAATNASVLGDAVLKVLWHRGRVKIVNIDPGRFFPVHATDDPTELIEATISWTINPPEAAANYQLNIARTQEALETWTADSFRIQIGNETPVTGPNPYGFIPFVHVPNLAPPNALWGASDLEDVIPLNRELDQRLSDQADLIRYHADPPVIFRGIREHSDLAVGPGTVWDIPTDAAVELLEWKSQPPAVEAHQARILTAIYDISESPRSSFGETSQAFSGVALEAQLQPIVQRTLRRRIVWEPALQDLASKALHLAEQFGFEGAQVGDFAPYRVHVVWRPMLPRNDAEEANRMIALTGAGLKSTSHAMEDMGVADSAAELAQVLADRETLGMAPTAVAPFQRGSLEETVP